MVAHLDHFIFFILLEETVVQKDQLPNSVLVFRWSKWTTSRSQHLFLTLVIKGLKIFSKIIKFLRGLNHNKRNDVFTSENFDEICQVSECDRSGNNRGYSDG